MLAAARAVGAGDLERFTHGTTVATNALARAQGRADGLRRDRGVRAPPPPPPPGPSAPVPALRAPPRAARAAGALLRSAPSASVRRACCARSTSSRCPRSTPRRSPSASSSRSATRATSVRSPRSCGAGCPARRVVASHEVAPEFREYERASTTAIDAYLGPTLARYLERLARACAEAGLPGAARHALFGRRRDDLPRRRPIPPSRSSPAQPRASSALRSQRARPGVENAISLDMGGTSTDVAPDHGRRGRAHRRARRRPASRSGCRASTCRRSAPAAARSPWVDEGGALRVGPESAGAEPGPACYGKGGTRPTVTRRQPPARAAPGAAGRRARARSRRPRSARSARSTRRRSSRP